jgi:hypothetical protein
MRGKAALARTHSKTYRTFGGFSVREASWSAERQFRFGPETSYVTREAASRSTSSCQLDLRSANEKAQLHKLHCCV